jgi:hypothetical protein
MMPGIQRVAMALVRVAGVITGAAERVFAGVGDSGLLVPRAG